MKEKEFYDKLWNDEKIYKEYENNLWDWVVTEAEIVEFSFVTTPSNRKSTINGIDEELIKDMSKHLNKSTEEVGNLFTKYNSMEVKENVVVEGEKVETNEAVLEVNALKSEVEVLKNSLETMKNDILARDEKIVTLTNELQQKDETLQANETLINELRKVEEEKVLAQANITKQDPKEEKTENSVNSLEDYKKKYS
jgi:chromosome segregation ATPase